MLRFLQNSNRLRKANGNRFQYFVPENTGAIFVMRAFHSMKVRPQKQRILARYHGNQGTARTAAPYRLLGAQLARKIDGLLQAPGWDQARDVGAVDLGDEFSAFEFGL